MSGFLAVEVGDRVIALIGTYVHTGLSVPP